MSTTVVVRLALGALVVAGSVAAWEVFVFLLLPLTGVPLMIGGAMTIWAMTKDRPGTAQRWARRTSYGIATVGAVAAAVYFWAWGVGFDYADSFRDEPPHVALALSWSYGVAAVAFVLLALVVVAVMPLPGRRRRALTSG
ncbi:hypothetical protein [Solicola sp. PLA-1-18]|uniref:hypothetical protein n=1 Tax=Solicola sp. PLA-1-18 TaxID=3380532 RepID=UPI003B7BCF8B